MIVKYLISLFRLQNRLTTLCSTWKEWTSPARPSMRSSRSRGCWSTRRGTRSTSRLTTPWPRASSSLWDWSSSTSWRRHWRDSTSQLTKTRLGRPGDHLLWFLMYFLEYYLQAHCHHTFWTNSCKTSLPLLWWASVEGGVCGDHHSWEGARGLLQHASTVEIRSQWKNKHGE